MTKYVALIRGIGPGNPNMKGDKLGEFFESLGFSNVATVIASGNVIFESDSKDSKKLEEKIEEELPKRLGFLRAVMIRSEGELKKLVAKDPFKGAIDETPNYLVVTFFKDKRAEICTIVDLGTGSGRTPDFMAKLERTHGKELTTRTWKTVNRILKKMDEN